LINYCECTQAECNIISSTKDDQIALKDKVTITPNPTFDFIKIETSLEIVKVEVIDQNGKIILTSRDKELDVSSFSPGMYYLKCIINKNESCGKKLIKI